jgi:hypothetical protein
LAALIVLSAIIVPVTCPAPILKVVPERVNPFPAAVAVVTSLPTILSFSVNGIE